MRYRLKSGTYRRYMGGGKAKVIKVGNVFSPTEQEIAILGNDIEPVDVKPPKPALVNNTPSRPTKNFARTVEDQPPSIEDHRIGKTNHYQFPTGKVYGRKKALIELEKLLNG